MKVLKKPVYYPPHPSVLTDRQRREYARLRRGLEEGLCILVTISRDFTSPVHNVPRPDSVTRTQYVGIHAEYVSDLYHDVGTIKRLRTEVRHRVQDDLPGIKAWCVLEYAEVGGWHVHMVFRGTRRALARLSPEYFNYHLSRRAPGFRAYVQPVGQSESDRYYLASYLTKSIGCPDTLAAAGRYFVQVTCSHTWALGWLPKTLWRALRDTWGLPGDTWRAARRHSHMQARRSIRAPRLVQNE